MAVSGLEFETFDVFTDTAFRGNPLAIVHVPNGRKLSQVEKQTIAREFNYSETVFLHIPAPESVPERWNIDIFTIDQELPFAGHPTIGTAWALGQMFRDLKHGTLITKAGEIPFDIERLPHGTFRAMASIPHNVHIHSNKLSLEMIDKLQPSLSKDDFMEASGCHLVSIVKGMTFALIELGSMAALEKVALSSTPTLPSVNLDNDWSPSFVATYFYVVQKGLADTEVVKIDCRMIEAGIGEDPATGSAASALAAFLAIERVKDNPQSDVTIEFELKQGVQMGRDSLIRLKVECHSGEIDRIFLSGSACQVMSGKLL